MTASSTASSIRRRAMTRRGRRLTLIAAAGLVLGAALALGLYAMRGSLVFFFPPAEVAAKQVQPGTRFRLGGLVKQGSIRREENGHVSFEVTDAQASIPVRFTGALPDLFREGQGVIAEGALDSAGLFRADTVLARHDETYMPREVADTLRQQGVWQGGERSAQSTQR